MQHIRQQHGLDYWIEKLPDYVSFALIILSGFLLARVVWLFFPASPQLPALDTQPTTSNTEMVSAQQRGTEIANYHLFGQPEVAKPAETKTIQNSPLALKLAGIVEGKHQRYAIINESGQQTVYAVGQAIGTSGAVLEDVKPDHVVLKRNNNLEKLPLPKTETSGGNGSGTDQVMDEPAMMDDMGNVPDTPPDIVPAQMETPPPVESAPNSNAIPAPIPPDAGAAVEPNMNAAKANLLSVVSPQPYEADGKFLGFKLMPGENAALFNQLGLQPGDLVTSLNGTLLDSPAAGMQAIQAASSLSQATLSITRGGQQLNLPISF